MGKMCWPGAVASLAGTPAIVIKNNWQCSYIAIHSDRQLLSLPPPILDPILNLNGILLSIERYLRWGPHWRSSLPAGSSLGVSDFLWQMVLSSGWYHPVWIRFLIPQSMLFYWPYLLLYLFIPYNRRLQRLPENYRPFSSILDYGKFFFPSLYIQFT